MRGTHRQQEPVSLHQVGQPVQQFPPAAGVHPLPGRASPTSRPCCCHRFVHVLLRGDASGCTKSKVKKRQQLPQIVADEPADVAEGVKPRHSLKPSDLVRFFHLTEFATCCWVESCESPPPAGLDPFIVDEDLWKWKSLEVWRRLQQVTRRPFTLVNLISWTWTGRGGPQAGVSSLLPFSFVPFCSIFGRQVQSRLCLPARLLRRLFPGRL